MSINKYKLYDDNYFMNSNNKYLPNQKSLLAYNENFFDRFYSNGNKSTLGNIDDYNNEWIIQVDKRIPPFDKKDLLYIHCNYKSTFYITNYCLYGSGINYYGELGIILKINFYQLKFLKFNFFIFFFFIFYF